MPEVTSISPTSVANPGSDSVTVYGSGFTDATHVWLGDYDAVSFSVQSDSEISAVSHHEYTSGSRVMVYVEGPDGKSADPPEAAWITLGEGATGDPGATAGTAPTVTSISPTTVANPGTDTIGVYGTGFTGATQVLIGDHPAINFSVQSDSEIWATTHHEYTTGSRVMVYVESPSGKSPNPPEDAWITLGEAAT